MPSAVQLRRIGVVVVDYNGQQLTLECLEALAATEWEGELHVVLVDNASESSVAEEVRERWPSVQIVRAPRNMGFAGGCNLGLARLGEVDAVALVNNDAAVDPVWLTPLVEALEADETLGAACPRILLGSKYADVELEVATHPLSVLDRRRVGVRVHGIAPVDPRLDDREVSRFADGFWGWEQPANGSGPYQWSKERSRLLVPVSDRGSRETTLHVWTSHRTTVSVRSGLTRAEVEVGPGDAQIAVRVEGEAQTIINNVGTDLRDDWYGADRGYEQPDDGRYSVPEFVHAWCGGGVLLRTEYLAAAGTFDERLFLYYEDLELSLRGARLGWRYRYVPDSVVHHRHSASSVDGSELAEYYKERNRLLVMTRHAPLTVVVRGVGRYVLSTLSYCWRDVIAPLATGARPRPAIVRRRVRSFAGWLRLAPAMLTSRRRDRHRRAARARSTSASTG